MFEWKNGLSITKRVEKNIANLISIRKGDVCFDRELGIGTKFLDKSWEDFTSSQITDMYDTIRNREPRADIAISSIDSISEDGEFKLNIETEVKNA